METDFYSIFKKYYDVDLYRFTKEMLLELNNIEKYVNICDEDIQQFNNRCIIFGLTADKFLPCNIHEYIKNFKSLLEEMNCIFSRKVFLVDNLDQQVGDKASIFQKIITDLVELFLKTGNEEKMKMMKVYLEKNFKFL